MTRLYIFICWLVALSAMSGSLYFSEIVQFFPCKLCWIQRTFMYPMVFILPLAFILNDYRVKYYCLVLSIIGGGVSAYHYLLQWDIWGGNACAGIACSTRYINYYGVVTIPFLALIAFILIIWMSLLIPASRYGRR